MGVIASSIRAFQPGNQIACGFPHVLMEGQPKVVTCIARTGCSEQPKLQVAPRRKATAVGSRQEVFSQSA